MLERAVCPGHGGGLLGGHAGLHRVWRRSRRPELTGVPRFSNGRQGVADGQRGALYVGFILMPVLKL